MSGYKGSVTVGIDIGTADSIIAYVGKAMVDIVQNEVSQRKTPTVVGFNDRERLLGDAASTVIKSNLKNTVRNFRHIMGAVEHCEAQCAKEKFWQLAKSETGEDGNLAFSVNYKGEQMTYSSTQIMAMYLTKMKETAETWCQAKVTDVVISVPSYFTDYQRQAMLDASNIAGLNCLRLMNECTATALAYGIYRTKDFDAEKPNITAFGHMGHSSFSISIVSFTPQKLTIMGEKTCMDCAGRDMDEVLIRHFASEFESKYKENPLDYKKALLKLEDACTKTKKVLSANDEAPVAVECLVEDMDLNSKISRDKFEELCLPLKQKCEATIMECIAEAQKNGLESVEDIQFVEIIGGASRVPWFQQVMQQKFGKDLSRTLNADECVARGCALQAAILSPAYKVRDFKVEDKVPHPITITWMGTNKDATSAEEKEKEGDAQMEEEPAGNLQQKNMEVFNTQDKMDQRRYITWYRNGPFDLGAKYSKTGTKLGDYKIALAESEQRKKIKIEAKMNIHGIFKLEQAHIVEIEEYEEIVKEKREIKDSEGDVPMPDAEGNTANGTEAPAEGAAAGDDKKKEEKKPKYEWVEVKKPKTRTKRTALEVIASGTPGIADDIIAKYKDVESKLISDSREVKENDNRRNELEAYIYSMREKVISDSGAVSAYMKKDDKEKFSTALTAAEDWLYDHFDATTVELVDKLGELQAIGGPAVKRQQDRAEVKEYVQKFLSTLSDIRALANNPSEDYFHICIDKRSNLSNSTSELEQWVQSKISEADKAELFEDYPIRVKDIKKKEKEIRDLAQTVMSEPKPQPAAPFDAPAAEANNATQPPQEGEHKAATEEGTGTKSPEKNTSSESAADTTTAGATDTTTTEKKGDSSDSTTEKKETENTTSAETAGQEDAKMEDVATEAPATSEGAGAAQATDAMLVD